MRAGNLLRIATLLISFGLAGSIAIAWQDASQQQSSDPVADAARRARDQKKAAPPVKKVYTNDDMPSVPQTPASDTTKAEGAAKNAEAKTEGADKEKGNEKANPDEDKNSEAYWRKRSKTLHDKLDTAQKELDILQREQDKDQVQYYGDPQKALMQQYSRADINEKKAKIDAKQKEVDTLKQQISDLEDAVRKAGGDPGWVR
jgi:hypothetical protein